MSIEPADMTYPQDDATSKSMHHLLVPSSSSSSSSRRRRRTPPSPDHTDGDPVAVTAQCSHSCPIPVGQSQIRVSNIHNSNSIMNMTSICRNRNCSVEHSNSSFISMQHEHPHPNGGRTNTKRKRNSLLLLSGVSVMLLSMSSHHQAESFSPPSRATITIHNRATSTSPHVLQTTHQNLSFRIIRGQSHTSTSSATSTHRHRHRHQHYATPSSSEEFPQQDYHDPEDENELYGGFDGISRQDFQRMSGVGANIQNNDRMAMMSRIATGDDDDDEEWEGYGGNMDMDMDIGVDDGTDEATGVSGHIMKGQAQKEDAGRNTPPAVNESKKSMREEDSPSVNATPTKTETARPDSFGNENYASFNGASRGQDNASQSSAGKFSEESFRSQFVTKTEPTNSPNNSVMNATQQQQQQSPNNQETTTYSTRQQRPRIPTEEIEHIKSSISLVDVVESYNLPGFTRTHSNSAKACCPFHDDNNPSMSIDDNRGLYKCFACGAGGDVFNFIREYDYLEGNNDNKISSRSGSGSGGEDEKMGYMQAVEYAAREFGDGDAVKDWNFSGAVKGEYEGMSEEAKEKIRERERKKDRIRQANTAAAAFYTKCLVTLPTAGKARVHLRSRSISPDSIRGFALGYAPDCYYGDEAKKKNSNTPNSAKKTTAGGGANKKKNNWNNNWGSGSLVEYLSEANFTPDEIVEAGLAVRTKKKQYNNLSDETTSGSANNNDDDDDDDEHDYSGLMDRFRSRLIVPIMDESGQNVIALGGRHLESATSDDDADGEDKKDASSFTSAKYINSPESLVFTKKNVLFNQRKAKRALDDMLKSKDASALEESSSATPAVVIVEGYFDAISLSNVGVGNVVASMGTALPVEQLTIAADMAENSPGSRIILCMDGDNAGKNAVERICSNNILSKVPKLNRNELLVATLVGEEVKDPSDFVDFAGGGENAGERFQQEVLNKAIPWDEWYVDRLIAKHDVNGKDGIEGSFSEICEEISTFLATFPSPADRTMRAHKIAESLVDLIASDKDEGSSSSLGMLRVNLESDILNMSSRKAGVREAMERRIEQTDGFTGESAATKMAKLASGGGASFDMDDDDSKMSKSALAKAKPSRTDSDPKQIPPSKATRPVVERSGRSYRAPRKMRQPKPPERHLVPHFNGFNFKHESDRDWLGISDNDKMKPKMHLGETPSPVEEKDRLRAETPIFGTNDRRQKKDGIVYFNSNDYIGKQYLSQEAIRAGYTLGDDRPSPSESIVEFMDKQLFERDADQMILQAESRLLHALAKFPQARAAMRTVYSTSTFGPSNLRWTSDEREWLFLSLTGSPEINPPVPVELLDGGTQFQLHSYFHSADRADCPEEYFNKDVIQPVHDPGSSSEEGIVDTTIHSSSDPSDSSMDSGEGQIEATIDSQNEFLGPEKEDLDSFLESSTQLDSQTETADENAHVNNVNEVFSGLLDEYFLMTDMFPSFSNNKIAQETRAELTVQETVATILRASSMKRFSIAKAKLTKIVNEMDHRESDEGEDQAKDRGFDDISSEELQELFLTVGSEVVDAQKSLYESDRSTDRVNSHLLDQTVTNGVQFKTTQADLARLDAMMDEHIASLPEDHHRPQTRGDDGTYDFGSDEFDGDIDPTFGGRNPDEYVVRGLPDGEGKWG